MPKKYYQVWIIEKIFHNIGTKEHPMGIRTMGVSKVKRQRINCGVHDTFRTLREVNSCISAWRRYYKRNMIEPSENEAFGIFNGITGDYIASQPIKK